MEILVVVALFAIISIVAAQSLFTSLKGANKTDANSRVRENLDFALQIMSRHLHNAKQVTCSFSDRIDYIDPSSGAGSFYLNTSGSDSYIASASAQTRLTNSNVIVSSITFDCTDSPTGNVPTSITITATGRDNLTTAADNASITTRTQVLLRTY